MIPVNDTMIVWALRYCLGRNTYAVNDCVNCLLENWESLREHTRTIILRDINEAIQDGDYGMRMDRRNWERVLRKGRREEKI